jgi:hypothetical protein
MRKIDWGGGMKIAPAFSTGPLWQFSSYKSGLFLLFRRVVVTAQ